MGWYIVNEMMRELGKPCNVCGEKVKAGDKVYLEKEGGHKDMQGFWISYGVVHAVCRWDEIDKK